MSAETDAYYGKDEPSATYKWGVAIPYIQQADTWHIVAWFKTKERATEYAKRIARKYAIARTNL